MNDPFPDEEEAHIAIVREDTFPIQVQSFAVVPSIDEDNACPTSLREAKRSPDWPKWKQAIDTELDQLNQMGTWKLVDKPPGVVPITNKFVL